VDGDEIFECRKSVAASRPDDSMVFQVSVFAKVALYRRGSLERCSQLMDTPFSGNGTIYVCFVAIR
jgi:hypothetical protein